MLKVTSETTLSTQAPCLFQRYEILHVGGMDHIHKKVVTYVFVFIFELSPSNVFFIFSLTSSL